MNLLNEILNAKTEQDARLIIDKEIELKDKESIKTNQLGFINGNFKTNAIHKGFIPLKTKIKYDTYSMGMYTMNSKDYFYDYINYIRKYNINSNGHLVATLEYFINKYFGLPGKDSRDRIFTEIAEKTETDEEYFNSLENNTIKDLKGKGAALCTERAALAQEILSLFGNEVYYCIGCTEIDNKEEPHAFNVIKRKNDYALVDYSRPVTNYTNSNNIVKLLPFIGTMTEHEFNNFINNNTQIEFDDYKYINNNKVPLDSKRIYVTGKYKIDKEEKVK